MKPFLGLLFLVLTISACSNGGGGGVGGAGEDPTEALNSCNNVITDDAITNFNSQQNEFRVAGSGSSVHCKAEVTVNGRVSKVEKNGRSDIRIYPKVQFMDVQEISRNTGVRYQLHLNIPKVKPDEVKRILKSLAVQPNENKLQYDEYLDLNGYLRFEKGSLYYLQSGSRKETEEGLEVYLDVSADDMDVVSANSKLASLAKNQTSVELMWRDNQQFYRQSFTPPVDVKSVWSNVEASAVLYSYIKESENSGTAEVLRNGISWAQWWNLDCVKLNSQLPELYNFADGEWQNPRIADNTSSSLVSSLKYLLKVNPSHSRKSVLEVYQQIDKYYDHQAVALQTALDYLAGKLWTPAQFEKLVKMANFLYPKLSSRALKTSEAILSKTGYDQTSADFMAKVILSLAERNLYSSFTSPEETISKAELKIKAGLAAGNFDFYFRVFDILVKDYRAYSQDAEKTTDQWVLTGRVTAENLSTHVDFLSWLKNDIYINFDEAIKTVTELIVTSPLDASRVSMFKDVLNWLKDSLYLSRTDALEKTKWYLGTQKMTSVQIAAFKNLVNWYVNDLYQTKTSSLEKAENLILKSGMTPEQFDLMKQAVNWMVNELYLTKSDAVQKGEDYFSTKKMTGEQFSAFKNLVNWYVNDLYQTKSSSLEKAENLIFMSGLKPDQLDLMKQAVNWLVNDLYLTKSDSMQKGETYLINGRMTKPSFAALKAEYSKLYKGLLSKQEALTQTEKNVLGI